MLIIGNVQIILLNQQLTEFYLCRCLGERKEVGWLGDVFRWLPKDAFLMRYWYIKMKKN